jgi:TolA-binding protein
MLKNFSSEDLNVKPMAVGVIGDCEMELGNQQEAASYYIQAARLVDNQLTTPLFLKKAGMTYSVLGNHEDALKLFNEIKTKYFKSDEAREIKKYIAREEQYLGK